MAKALVLQRSFIGNRLVEPGEVIDYDGPFGANIEAVKDEPSAKAKKAKPAAEGASNSGTPGNAGSAGAADSTGADGEGDKPSDSPSA